MPHCAVAVSPVSTSSYYEILSLPDPRSNSQEVPAQKIKAAYRASLLRHHPDKAQGSIQTFQDLQSVTGSFKGSQYSIDQITQAYAILSVPELRAQYDRELILSGNKSAVIGQGDQTFKTGVEFVDLDDLDFDEADEIWYRSCRCGDGRGFILKEAELEEAVDDGEINVGCRGCSLWMKVLFGVVDDVTEGP